MTEDAISEIALCLSPRVCMAGQTLIEQDQVCQRSGMGAQGLVYLYLYMRRHTPPHLTPIVRPSLSKPDSDPEPYPRSIRICT